MADRVFIVEDNEVIRKAYAELIGRESDLVVCGEARSASEAMQQIPICNPALVIVDISLVDTNGLELIRQLHARWPQLLMLVISGHAESFYAKKAIQAGARGYVMKSKVRLIITAVRQVLSGQLYVSEQVRARLEGQGSI